MIIPQPLQTYCNFFMSQLVSTTAIPNTTWCQSIYTEINRKSLQQCWYEHAIIFPLPGDSTEFCIELNYEPKLGLRCAYGIRKDKPKKRRYNQSLVSAFKGYSASPFFEVQKYSSYKPNERLDPDHWVVWRFFPLNVNNNTLVLPSKNFSGHEIPDFNPDTVKIDSNRLADYINKFYNAWKNSEY